MTVSVHLSLSSSFLDSAQSLLNEAGTSLAQFGVCDNIDLPTILQVTVTGVDVLSIDDRSKREDQVGWWSTVELPNKGHLGDNINSAVAPFVERWSSFGGSKCIKTVGNQIFGTSTCVLCREIYCIVSLSRRVHYRSSQCILPRHWAHLDYKPTSSSSFIEMS